MKVQALVVAGPNGSGKTTFAREYLEQYPSPYISADVIAEGLSESIEETRLEVGKRFLSQVTEQINKRESFVVESTLSGLTLIWWIVGTCFIMEVYNSTEVALGEGELVEVPDETLFELFLRIASEEVI